MGLKLPNLSQKVFVCTISHEPVGRFQPDLQEYNTACYLMDHWMECYQICKLYKSDRNNSLLDFDDLDVIFKITASWLKLPPQTGLGGGGHLSSLKTQLYFFYISDVVRSCLPVQMENTCKESEQGGYKGEVCTCISELCNGSDVTKVTIATGIMTAIVILKNILW